MKHTLLLLLAFIAAIVGPQRVSAQPTIDANLFISPTPSPYLSDWQSQPNSVRITANLILPYNQPVKLDAQVSLNGQVVARTKPEKMPMLSLNQGMNTFNAVSIIPFQAVSFVGGIDQASQRTGRLPEGNYEICVRFINAETGVSLASVPCKPFTILDVQPPVLISPANNLRLGRKMLTSGEQTRIEFSINVGDLWKLDRSAFVNLKVFDLISEGTRSRYSSVAPEAASFTSRLMEHEGIFYRFRKQQLTSEVPIAGDIVNTVFTWLPPMPSPGEQVHYRLRVVPILPGQNQHSAIESNSSFGKDILLSKTTADFDGDGISDLVTYNLTKTDRFAWAVQAQDERGNPIGKNNGWSEIWTFSAIGNNPDTRIGAMSTLESFFDVFQDADQPMTPCPYHYKKYIRNFYTPCKDGKMEMYGVYDIFRCSLHKGHSGPHHGTIETVYVHEGSVGCSDRLKGEPLPIGAKTITRDELAKIPTAKEADKADVTPPAVPAKEPCPYSEKKLLRTVAGSWKRGATTVRHITYRGTTVAWADVIWTRDIWNVFDVSHCTLDKGHGGGHKLGPAKEEFTKAVTVTETVTYGPGVPQAPPKPHFTDGLPQEDPK